MNRTLVNWVHKLEDIMVKLRGPSGCPWDKEQTHESLKKYVVEETYELIDAIESGEDAQIIDELGDLLLQVVFHCQIGKEDNRFNLQDVAKRSCDKMIRRHPHVFGDKTVKNSKAVLKQWEKIKRTEPTTLKRNSILEGIPRSLPALAQAEKVQVKASKVGFDWSCTNDVLKKVEEELSEFKTSVEKGDKNNIREELGDLLFSVVNLCRFHGESSAEEILMESIIKFRKRFKFMEIEIAQEGKGIHECSIGKLEGLWQKSKIMQESLTKSQRS